MLRIRIVAMAATTGIALGVAAGAAAAQSAGTDQAGKPLPPLQLIKQTSATTPAAHTDSSGTVAKKTKIKRVAGKKHNGIAAQAADPPPDSAQSSASADAWLAASATPASSVPTTAPADTAPASQPGNAPPDNIPANDAQTAQTGKTPSDDRALPSAVVVGGQTVPVTAADQVNEIDLAADNTPPITQPNTQPKESTEPRSDRTDVIAAADTMNQAAMDQAAMAQAAMAKAMPSRAAFVAPEPADAGQNASNQANDQNTGAAQNDSAQNISAQDTSAVGSASWIAQVLAALGGAIAAGTVAWFLIGAGPVGSYG
jgi:hypothetical protein